jgi:bilin biosynthesis protein
MRKSAVSPLILAMQDSDPEVRKAAVSALGKLDYRAALDPLESAVIRVLAKLAIANIARQSAAGDC